MHPSNRHALHRTGKDRIYNRTRNIPLCHLTQRMIRVSELPHDYPLNNLRLL